MGFLSPQQSAVNLYEAAWIDPETNQAYPEEAVAAGVLDKAVPV